jgi:hypothetical protein
MGGPAPLLLLLRPYAPTFNVKSGSCSDWLLGDWLPMLLAPKERLPRGGLLGMATCVGEWHPFCFFLPDSSLLNRPRVGVLVLVEGAGLLLGQPCGVLLLLPCPAAACQAAEELTSPGPGVSESDTSPELLRECCLPGLTLPPMNRRWWRSLESADGACM